MELNGNSFESPREEHPLVITSVMRRFSGNESYIALDSDVTEMESKISELDAKETELTAYLADLQQEFAKKFAVYEDKRNEIAAEKLSLTAELTKKAARLSICAYPPARGPPQLAFVDSVWFGDICNLVVVLNLACMGFGSKLQEYHSILQVLDQLFLVWYLFELLVKWIYHRSDLFCGSLSVVWWNWLDAAIVISGVVDQWLMVLVRDLLSFEHAGSASWLRWLRLLRLFRIMRFLKVVKAFVQGDLSWTEQPPFQLFMTAVIFANSVIMALELDVDWAGWYWIEQAFLIVYSFELFVRLKATGWHFFVNSDLVWNNLDFIMVCGGAFDLWFMPAWSLIQVQLYGKAEERDRTFLVLLKMLRLMRILRVLRLVRLLKMVKPLYALLIGVLSALDAMKWVMVLTLLVLYAGAIVFTSLVGHGYIYPNIADIPAEAEVYFGSVTKSLFSLFKLKNGDTSVVEPITTDAKGQLLFAGFMILSNWAILAILTSVVSDHMICASNRLADESKEAEEEEFVKSRTRRLKLLFEDMIDTDRDGKINKSEWDAMLADENLKQELCDASGLDMESLCEIYFCLTDEGEAFDPSDFIANVEHAQDAVDRKQMVHLRFWLEKVTLERFETLEAKIQKQFEAMGGKLEQTIQRSSKVQE